MSNKCGLAALLHSLYVTERNPSLKEMSRRIGFEYHTLYSRVIGRVVLRPEEIRLLIRESGDIRLAEWLLEDSPFMPVYRPDADIVDGQSEGVRRLHRTATHAVIEAVELLREVELAIEDDKVDHNDLREIKEALTDAEQALGTLRANIDARFEQRRQ